MSSFYARRSTHKETVACTGLLPCLDAVKATLRQTLSRIAALAAPYFRSEEKWRARMLLRAAWRSTCAGFSCWCSTTSGMRRFYDALQNKNQAVFWREIVYFCWIAILRYYLTLQLRWRA